MKVLLVSAPADYGYINLCYRYVELGEVANYLGKQGHSVRIIDGLTVNKNDWDSILLTSLNDTIEAVILHHSGENVVSTLETLTKIRAVRRHIPVITYGIVSIFSTAPFESYPFNAIVINGDWEVILADWLKSLQKKYMSISGVAIKPEKCWQHIPGEKRINPGEWGLPSLELLPLDEYKKLYANHQMIAGIQGSFEVSLSISRGCPYKCWYCPVSHKDGNIERRRPVKDVIEFLHTATRDYGFNQIAMFSPCFTLDKEWVNRFCDAVIDTNLHVSWRCVTTQVDIDKVTIQKMASAGCWRIGIGIETLNPKLQSLIGKPVDIFRLSELFERLNQAGIKPMCFLLDGLPGQSPYEAEQDAQKIIAMGSDARVSKLIYYGKKTKEIVSFDQNDLAREVKFLQSAKQEIQ
jgi:radical SAM superfamily enzyme YgiQ (UPF0313 family)